MALHDQVDEREADAGAREFLFGVQPLDLPTFAGVVLVVAACGLAASALPAVRASRVDPATAFRHE